jgi:hypothetical protein
LSPFECAFRTAFHPSRHLATNVTVGSEDVAIGSHQHGRRGSLWFTENLGNKIGRLSIPGLQVSPATDITASGTQGQAFSPTSFQYKLSATINSLKLPGHRDVHIDQP